MRPSALILATALLATCAAFGAEKPKKGPKGVGPVHSASEAKAIAERETGGIALSARRTSLNGATCGWEVEVHMPKEDRGWRCTVDCDTHMVYTKDRIPNPSRGKKK